MLSSLVGGLVGVGQTSVRHILAYSSIGHCGWFLSLFCFSFFFGSVYFFIYFFRTFFLIFFFWLGEYNRVSQIFLGSWLYSVVLLILLLTVSGVPPFLGFFSKLFVFFRFMDFYLGVLMLSVLLAGSIFRLYFYLGLFFSCFFLFICEFFVDLGKFFWSIFVLSFFLFSSFSLVFIDFFFFLFYDILI